VNKSRPLVAVVDDDESVRESLPDLLTLLGYDVQAFSSAEAFLTSDHVANAKCMILDIAMPGMSGPELAAELRRQGNRIPIVFISAHRDEISRLRVGKNAVTCLLKPFSDTAVANALEAALRTQRE
jgi:FixJ family two-component response regulator